MLISAEKAELEAAHLREEHKASAQQMEGLGKEVDELRNVFEAAVKENADLRTKGHRGMFCPCSYYGRAVPTSHLLLTVIRLRGSQSDDSSKGEFPADSVQSTTRGRLAVPYS